MYKIFKSLVIVIWIIDIMNINVSGVPWLSWLQPILVDGVGFDALFWLIILSILPSADLAVRCKKED